MRNAIEDLFFKEKEEKRCRRYFIERKIEKDETELKRRWRSRRDGSKERERTKKQNGTKDKGVE